MSEQTWTPAMAAELKAQAGKLIEFIFSKEIGDAQCLLIQDNSCNPGLVLAALAEIERQATEIKVLQNDIEKENGRYVWFHQRFEQRSIELAELSERRAETVAMAGQLQAENTTIAEELESYEREFEKLHTQLSELQNKNEQTEAWADGCNGAAIEEREAYRRLHQQYENMCSWVLHERERAKAWRDVARECYDIIHAHHPGNSYELYEAALALEAAHEKPHEHIERGPERRIAKSDGYYGPFRRARTTGTDRRCWTQEDFDKAAIRKAELDKLFVDTEEIDRRKEQS